MIEDFIKYHNESYLSPKDDFSIKLKTLSKAEIYIPILSDIPCSLINELYLSAVKNNIEDAKNIIIKYFSDNNWERLEEMIKSWKECGSRYGVFYECLKILKKTSNEIDKSYLVIIPTLLSQIEGIIKDIQPTPYSCSTKKGQEKTIIYLNNNKIFFQKNEVIELIKEYFGENYSQRDNPKLRNNILHGDLWEYGSTFYMIQLFLMIEMLSISLED